MKHDDKPRLLNYYGNMSMGQGYSGSIEQNIIALDKRPDIDVRVMSFSKRVPHENISGEGWSVKSKPFILADVGIIHGFPVLFDHNQSRKFKVGYTMFETDTLPNGKEWAGKYGDAAKMINECCDLLIVPCQHNVEVFKNAGVTIPIEVVGNGINVGLFPYVDRSNRPAGHKFTFFMHGTLTLRKNPGMVISAFAALFRDNPDVRLVLKTQSGTLGHMEFVDMGDIEVIDALWTPERLLEAFADADAYVFPSRGEGFGIPPLEAMATGLPTIVSTNSGMAEYADERYCFPVDTDAIVPAKRYPPKWGDCGNWYEPSYDQLKAHMRYVYENYEDAKRRGIAASAYVHENWNYDVIAAKLVDAIAKHYPGWQ